jgi:hypothetical protein
LQPAITFEANSIQILAIRVRFESAENGDWRVYRLFTKQAVGFSRLFEPRPGQRGGGGPVASGAKTKPLFTIG